MSDLLHHTPVGGGDCIQVLGDRVTFLGTVDQPDLVMAEVAVPPGAGTPLHRHASPELFRILAGKLVFSTLDGDGRGRRILATAGDAVSIPAGAAHGYHNDGAAPATMLAVFDSSLERFFRAVAAAAPTDVARVVSIARAHGIDIIEAPAAAA